MAIRFTLWWTYKKQWKMAIDISWVFPLKMGGSFHSFVYVYQRVIPLNPIKPPFSYGFPMVFLWFSYGFPMIIPLNQRVLRPHRSRSEAAEARTTPHRAGRHAALPLQAFLGQGVAEARRGQHGTEPLDGTCRPFHHGKYRETMWQKKHGELWWNMGNSHTKWKLQ